MKSYYSNFIMLFCCLLFSVAAISQTQIVPAAGATETFTPAEGDFFYDPGGPVSPSANCGTTGDVADGFYPNCGCATISTLDGVTTIDFLSFDVFGSFDFLEIFDGPTTAAPKIFDSRDAGNTLAAIIAEYGSSEFTGTSGSLTFSFFATAVVNRCGYEVEVLEADNQGDIPGCTDPAAINYNPDATVDDGSCIYDGPVMGCTDPAAINYNPNATVDDGSCQYGADICSNAIPLGCGQPVNGSTVGADDQSDFQSCGVSITGPGVWHSYVGTGRNTEVNTCGSGFDTKITVVTGSCDGGLTCVGANDDACGLQSSVTFMAEFGQTYYILVHGFGSTTGDYVLNAVCGVPTVVLGCTDPEANNYNPLANQDDGSCEYDQDQPCLSTRVWPSSTFTPDCTGSAESITSGGWADEYSRVNVVSGTEYTFSSSVATDYITISDNSNNQVFIFGEGPQTWVATFTGIVRFHTHLDADCTRQNVSRTRFVQCGGSSQAVNASCEGAIAMDCGDIVTGNTSNGSLQVFSSCGTSITSKGLWYSFTGTGYPVEVNTCGSSFDTKLSVWAGQCDDELNCVGGNDDGCSLQSSVDLQWTQLGATYYVLVHGFGSATGDFSLELNCAVPGCTDPLALNYNPDATFDDGTCIYRPGVGCTDPDALNYDPDAIFDDGSCEYEDSDCETAIFENYCYGNFDNTLFTYTSANNEPLTLEFISGLIESCCDDIIVYDGPDQNSTVLYSGNNNGVLTGLTFNSTGSSISFQVDSDGSVSCQSGSRTVWEWAVFCTGETIGCTDQTAINYDVNATIDDGSCRYPISCDNPIIETYCYTNNDNTLFTYTSANNGPLSLEFISGTIESCCDDIIVYDGPDQNSAELYNGNNGGDLAGLTFNSTGSSISFQVDSDNSISCLSGSRTVWEWAVFCTGESLGCTDQTAINYDMYATIDDGSCRYPISCDSPITETYCYNNDDNTLFTYTSANNGPLSLEFISGTIESCCDDIIVYDGPDQNSSVLYSGNNNGNLAGLTFNSTGSSISFQVDSDGSISCQSGSRTTWEWNVSCFVLPLEEPETRSSATAQTDLFVYPNPASTELNLDVRSFLGETATIVLRNSLGQAVHSRNLGEIRVRTERIDLSQFPAGMYFITLDIEGGDQLTKRVILDGNR